MASGFNKVILVGNLTRDPKASATSSGTNVCNFSLAVNGVKQNDVTFVDITTWDKVADICMQYLRKGRQCLVEGRLQTSSWEDKKTGEKRTKLYVNAYNMQLLGSGEAKEHAAVEPQAEDTDDADVPF